MKSDAMEVRDLQYSNTNSHSHFLHLKRMVKDPHQFTQGEASCCGKYSPNDANVYGPKTNEVSCLIKESYESSSTVRPQKSQRIFLPLETSFTYLYIIASRH